jgi:type III pantothenate kinase
MSGLLAIDVSNILTALALWDGDREVHHWQLSSNPLRPADEYRVLLSRLLTNHGLDTAAVGASVMACVVPALTVTLSTACRDLFGQAPLVVGAGIHTGLRISTENPREVGPDRIANAVAARDRWGSPVIVLDFGTALTIDVIGAEGDYLGAIIAPGIEVAAEALAQRTAQLPLIELAPPPRAIATDTEHGLQSGLVFGYLGLVEGLVERTRSEIGPAPVVATGEAAWVPTLLSLTSLVDAYDPRLTLDGLRRIYLRHTGRG